MLIFLRELVIGVVIQLSTIIAACLIMNYVATGLLQSVAPKPAPGKASPMPKHGQASPMPAHSLLWYLVIFGYILGLVIILYGSRMLVQMAVKTPNLSATILSLTGPMIGAGAIYFSPLIRELTGQK